SVAHRLGLAVGRGDGARVEVIPPDHHRCLDLSAANELVDRQTSLRTVAVAKPADPRGQPLERNPPGRHAEPPLQKRIVRRQLPPPVVDRCDVSRIAGQHCPPERTDSATKERPDIGRDEARVCERVLYTTFTRLTPQIVAIIENIDAPPDVLE